MGINKIGDMIRMGVADSSISADQSQKLQSLLGISEKDVGKVVNALANEKGVSQPEAANQLIGMFGEKTGQEGVGSPDGGAGGMEDANGNGIPDKIEVLVASGQLSPEAAGELLKAMGVSQNKIDSFLAFAPSATGSEGVGGVEGNQGFQFADSAPKAIDYSY